MTNGSLLSDQDRDTGEGNFKLSKIFFSLIYFLLRHAMNMPQEFPKAKIHQDSEKD